MTSLMRTPSLVSYASLPPVVPPLIPTRRLLDRTVLQFVSKHFAERQPTKKMAIITEYAVSCLTILLAVSPTQCAPKSRKPETPHAVYDQRQTGDYNIQLHLKDFQIIALLADDTAALGDYDYSYDYSDFTATQKPLDQSTPNKPYPTVSPSTENPPPKEETSESTAKPTGSNDIDASTTTAKAEEALSPGKIKVQIIGAPPGVGIVPGEDAHEEIEAVPLGEASAFKQCSSGFTRDKRGRCRRVRRPSAGSTQFSNGFSKLASRLASRLRKGSAETSVSSSSSESVEN